MSIIKSDPATMLKIVGVVDLEGFLVLSGKDGMF